MSSDLVSCLRLDEECGTGRVIVAKEINGCDSSFIVSCVIAHCIKNKYPLLIVTTHNSLPHYQNVGLKMNYNLNKHLSDGLIEFYNLGKNYVNCLLQGKHLPLTSVLEDIKGKLSQLKIKYNRVYLTVDGVSHLFDLQYSLKEVNGFCHSLINVIRDISDSFIFFHCNVACEDDTTQVIANLLSHKAYTEVSVESLPSGWSLDVSGHIVISHPGEKFDDEHMYIMDLKSSLYLFKLFEKGVKLFAPGTV